MDKKVAVWRFKQSSPSKSAKHLEKNNRKYNFIILWYYILFYDYQFFLWPPIINIQWPVNYCQSLLVSKVGWYCCLLNIQNDRKNVTIYLLLFRFYNIFRIWPFYYQFDRGNSLQHTALWRWTLKDIRASWVSEKRTFGTAFLLVKINSL